MNLLECIQEVGDMLNMTITDTSTVTKSQVIRELNNGKDFVFNRLISLGQNFNTRITIADLEEGQAHYSLPKDFRKFVTLKIGYRNKDCRVKARELDVTNADDFSCTETSPRYIELGNIIEIRPTPQKSIVDGLYFYYIENLKNMVNDDDETGLPLGYDSLIATYATSKCKLTLGLEKEADNLYKIFKNELEEMCENIVEKNIDSPDMIVNLDTY